MTKKTAKKAPKPLVSTGVKQPAPANSIDLSSSRQELKVSAPIGKPVSLLSQGATPVAATTRSAETPRTSTPLPVRKAVEPTADGGETVKPRTTRTVSVAFSLQAPEARQVSLCGEFNEWAPEATPMRQTDGGVWATTLTLEPGRYQYKFLVDGQWVHDPQAQESVSNGYGSLNSVIEARA